MLTREKRLQHNKSFRILPLSSVFLRLLPSPSLPQTQPGERCRLFQRGPGLCPAEIKFSAFLASKYSIWWEQIERFWVIFGSIFSHGNRPKMTYLPYFAILEAVRFMIFGRQICVFGRLAPMPAPVHASMEDITSSQSLKKIFTAIIQHKEGAVVLLFLLGTSVKLFYTVYNYSFDMMGTLTAWCL